MGSFWIRFALIQTSEGKGQFGWSRVLEKGQGELFIHALFVVACSLQSISRLVSRTFSMAYYAGLIGPGRMHASLMQQDFLVFGNCFVKIHVNVFSMYGYRILGTMFIHVYGDSHILRSMNFGLISIDHRR